MTTHGALRNKMVDPNFKYIEPINTSINKICGEAAVESGVRLNMERLKKKSSEARGTVDVMNHIVNSNQGRAAAILAIQNGIESANKEPGQNTGVDIVKILKEGAKLVETGHTETHTFVLQGKAKDYDNQVTGTFPFPKNMYKYNKIINKKF